MMTIMYIIDFIVVTIAIMAVIDHFKPAYKMIEFIKYLIWWFFKRPKRQQRRHHRKRRKYRRSNNLV